MSVEKLYKLISYGIIAINIFGIIILSLIPYGVGVLLSRPEIPLQFRSNYSLPIYIMGFTPQLIFLISIILITIGNKGNKKWANTGMIISCLMYFTLYLLMPNYHVRSSKYYGENNLEINEEIREYEDGKRKYFKWTRESSNGKIQNNWKLDSTAIIE